MIERKSRLGVATTGGTEEGAEAEETTREKPRGWRHERKAWGRSDTAAERSTLQAADLVCVRGEVEGKCVTLCINFVPPIFHTRSTSKGTSNE